MKDVPINLLGTLLSGVCFNVGNRQYQIMYTQNNHESLHELKNAFFGLTKLYYPTKQNKIKWAAEFYPYFDKYGFRIIEKNICKHCLNLASKGCCDN